MVINTNSSSYQHAIVVICIVSSVVSSLLVAIRVWTRTFISHSMGRDDCKLSCLRLLVVLPLQVTDASLVTLVGTSPHDSLHFLQPHSRGSNSCSA